MNERSPCLAKKFSEGISNLKIAVFVSKIQSKNQTSESSDVFSNSSDFWTNIHSAWRKSFQQGYQIWKLQSSSQKFNQKTKLLEVLFFFQFFKTLNEHIPCLAEKFSAGISKMKIAVFVSKDQSKNQTSESSLFFSISSEVWTNIYRAWRKTFRQGYQNWKLQLSSHKIKQKIKLLQNLFFFQSLQNFERTYTVLGEKVLGRGIKLEICTLCHQSINLRIKILFESFVSFHWFRTWNMKFLDLWRQSFHPGCQSCILLGYMNFLWDVGIRSDITWRETLFEPWQKNFDLFVKTALYVSKGTLWVKKQLLKVLIFFKHFRFLNERSPCLAKKFSAGISKLKIAVFVWKYQSKNQTSESSLFFQVLQNFERTFTVLGEKHFGRDIKIENCSLRLKRSIKKPNFWKFWFFFQTLQVFERTFTVLGEKIFSRDIKIENSSLRLKRSIKKPNFRKFWFFFKLFRFLNEHSPCLAKKFSAGISKLKIAVVVSKDQSKNQTSESSDVFSNSSGFLSEHLPCLAKNISAGISKLKIAVFVSKDQSKNQTSESCDFFFKLSRFLNEHSPCLPKKFSAGISKLKIAVIVS